MQLVVPSAVKMALITDAKICSVHLMVSFFVIAHLPSNCFQRLSSRLVSTACFRVIVRIGTTALVATLVATGL